jgi:hypothetical protein
MSGTMALYGQEISRALWFRQAETRCRFLFAPEDPRGLVIAPLGAKGTQTIAQATGRLQGAGLEASSGAMIVDGDGDPVFCLAKDPVPFLRALAGWAGRHVAQIPVLGTLQTAGAARLAAAPDDDASIKTIRLEQLEVVRDPELWQGLLPTDDAAIAAIIEQRLPGERLWFWISNQVLGDVVPLLLQPVAWDPNRDRLDAQIRRLEAEGAGEGVTGYAYLTEEGRFQFVSGALRMALMAELADWVRQQQSACPALAQLAHCQFVRVQAGRVLDILENPELWSGIAAPAAPGTLAAAADTLDALIPGGSLWLWLTAHAPGGFLALAPVAGDRDGARFQAQMAGLYRRFPQSYRDAMTGTLAREPGGTLRIDWHAKGPGQAGGVLASIARRESRLQPLADAVLASGTT